MKYYISLSLLLAVLAVAFTFPPRTITGKVTDDKGNPIPFASIHIKGTKTGVAADANGNFSLSITKDNTVIVFSAIGFNNKEVKITTQQTVNIALIPNSNTTSEVVVTTALGMARKSKQVGYASKFMVADQANAPSYQMMEQGYAIDEDKNNWRNNADYNTEGYDRIVENPFLKATDNPLSTFSIDVDAASYSNVRRIISSGNLPPAGAVRIEEMINYFSYQYPQPKNDDPFSVNTEIAKCPWNTDHKLVLIGLQGKKIPMDKLPASNLTFLIDVSGSMMDYNKLPLVKSSMKLLVDQLREQDKVSIVVYAGNAGLVLKPTSGDNKQKIKEAIDGLEAGGSTAGGAGIELAYKTAQSNFIKEGNNRVILCTDGDFNVGQSSDDALERMIEDKRKGGVFLTVLGYGMGNYQDAKMQKLADKGNGNHAYIDGINEAKKVLVNEFGGTLFTIAKDVKLQIEFNPLKVQGYRLIGYENRMLAKEDFNNDKKDAGEMGSGHTVTALYEVIPVGVTATEMESVDALRYQKTDKQANARDFAGELMNIKLRYKQPDGDVSKLLQTPLQDGNSSIEKASENFRFAAAVAQFGMLLRDSKYKGDADFEKVTALAENATGKDIGGYRKEFLQLVENASLIADKKLSKN